MSSIATIGVYGFDRDSFLAALAAAKIDLLLDVRQRRGVRGSEYAWANARRLQAALEEGGIGYSHLKELAPTTELRQVPEACHRSLIAARLEREWGFSVTHLRPEGATAS